MYINIRDLTETFAPQTVSFTFMAQQQVVTLRTFGALLVANLFPIQLGFTIDLEQVITESLGYLFFHHLQ